MIIESLADHPEYVKVVTDWIYYEFFENIRDGVPYEQIHDTFKGMTRNEIPCTFVAVENGECLGTGSLWANDLTPRPDLTPWLGGLYISEAHRNKGIAKVLMEKVTDTARELGYKILYLRTESASEYYAKLGWEMIFQTSR